MNINAITHTRFLSWLTTSAPALVAIGMLVTACGGAPRAATTAPNQPVNQAPAQNAPPTSPNQPAPPAANTAAIANQVATNAPTQPPKPSAAPTSASTTVSATGDCANYKFQKVTAHAKNSAYPAPALTVSCNDTQVTIKSNGIPNFEFVRLNPGTLTAQNYTWTIPQKPIRAAATTIVPLGGPTGITINGLPIFGPTEAPFDGYQDPYAQGILDYCNGHIAQRGDYHLHARPNCIVSEAEMKKPGTVLGYAFDGYPILTPYVCADTSCANVVKVTSSWKLTNPSIKNSWQRNSYVAGAGDLDQCNGKSQPNGGYAYYATDSFPYFMGCYIGTPSKP